MKENKNGIYVEIFNNKIFASDSEIFKGFDVNGDETIFTKNKSSIFEVSSGFIPYDLFCKSSEIQDGPDDTSNIGNTSDSSKKASDLKMPKCISKSDLIIIKSMYNAGRLHDDICKLLKRGKGTISNAINYMIENGELKRRKIKRARKRSYLPEEDKIITTCNENGMRAKEIGRKLGRKAESISRRIEILEKRGEIKSADGKDENSDNSKYTCFDCKNDSECFFNSTPETCPNFILKK